jgi:hypothetical protein
MNPNIAPTTEMAMVCYAASSAAARNKAWEAVPADSIRGPIGEDQPELAPFKVSLGGRTFTFYLSSDGYLYEKRRDRYEPILLADYTSNQLERFKQSLDALAA